MHKNLIAGMLLLVVSHAASALLLPQVVPNLFSGTVLCQNSTACVNQFQTTSAFDARHFTSTSMLGGNTITSTYDGVAAAHASYGELGSSATVALTNYRTGSYIGASGNSTTDAASGIASFTDYLTVQGGTGSGVLHLTFDVDGTLNNGGSSLFIGSEGRLQVNSTQVALHNGSSVQQFTVPFAFGTQFQLAVTLFSTIALFDNAAHGYTDPYSWAGFADFIDTASLVALSVTTPGGQLIPTATITSLSGTVYGAVPEPSALFLALAGVMILAFLRRTPIDAAARRLHGPLAA